jgi:hypothetical protein
MYINVHIDANELEVTELIDALELRLDSMSDMEKFKFENIVHEYIKLKALNCEHMVQDVGCIKDICDCAKIQTALKL